MQVAYSSQPFPLNLLMPWHARREVARRYVDTPGEAIYAGALAALKALTERLRSSVGRYLMGDTPCSLDALVFGHLLFLRSSPCAAPVLQSAVRSVFSSSSSSPTSSQCCHAVMQMSSRHISVV
jgi:metaxin